MKINEADLKALYKSSIQGKTPQSRSDCPSMETISGLFLETASESEKAKVIDHITTCSLCHEEFDLFLNISRDESRLFEELKKNLQPKKRFAGQIHDLFSKCRSRFLWKYVSIPLLAALSLMVIYFAARFYIINSEPEERGRLLGPIRLISPGHDIVSDAPLVFKWDEIKPADYVILEIFDESLLLIWKSQRIRDNFYELPLNARKKIKKAKLYFWMVTAVMPDGSRIESSLQEFVIRE
jgi:hypothetical protein